MSTLDERVEKSQKVNKKVQQKNKKSVDKILSIW